MAELTDREKAIVHEMFYLMNPITKAVPFDTRLIALKMMLKIRKVKISEDELKDLSHAIDQEQKLAMQQGFGFLDKHKEMMKRIDDIQFE